MEIMQKTLHFCDTYKIKAFIWLTFVYQLLKQEKSTTPEFLWLYR